LKKLSHRLQTELLVVANEKGSLSFLGRHAARLTAKVTSTANSAGTDVEVSMLVKYRVKDLV
jgi:hypothetical protein